MRRAIKAYFIPLVCLTMFMAACGSDNDGTRTDSSESAASDSPSVAETSDTSSDSASGSAESAPDGVPALNSLQGRTMEMSSWGGVWTESTQKYFVEPFEKETGVKVNIVVNGNDTAAPVLLQYQNGHVTTDLIDGGVLNDMLDRGALEKLPDGLNKVLAETSRPNSTETGYSWDNYGTTATLITCNPKIVEKCPSNAAEYWDVQNFPGTRAMVNTARSAMTFALLADGPNALKISDDGGLDRAIEKLNEIKPHINVWTASGAQMQQTISDGEVGISYMWNGRAYVVKRDVEPDLIMNWGDSTTQDTAEGLAVTKGAPNADVAFAYIYWISQHPEAQAKWTEALTYPTPTKELFDLVSPEVAAALPDGPDTQTEHYDSEWFAKNASEVQKAWQQMLTG